MQIGLSHKNISIFMFFYDNNMILRNLYFHIVMYAFNEFSGCTEYVLRIQVFRDSEVSRNSYLKRFRLINKLECLYHNDTNNV